MFLVYSACVQNILFNHLSVLLTLSIPTLITVEWTGNEADYLGYIQLEYHHHGCMASKSPVRKKICRVVPRHLTLPHPQLCHRHLA